MTIVCWGDYSGNTHILVLGDFNLHKVSFTEYTYTGGENSTEFHFFNLTGIIQKYEVSSWVNRQSKAIMFRPHFYKRRIPD